MRNAKEAQQQPSQQKSKSSPKYGRLNAKTKFIVFFSCIKSYFIEVKQWIKKYTQPCCGA